MHGSQSLSQPASVCEVAVLICRDRRAHQHRGSTGEAARKTDGSPKRHDSKERSPRRVTLTAALQRDDALSPSGEEVPLFPTFSQRQAK